MEEGPMKKPKGKGIYDSRWIEHTELDDKMKTRELIERKASRMI